MNERESKQRKESRGRRAEETEQGKQSRGRTAEEAAQRAKGLAKMMREFLFF
jgi:hypothetical protein